MGSVTFLMCSERSGSNLVSRLFGAHSEIFAPYPAHILRIFGQNIHRYDEADDESWAAFSEDLQDLFEAKWSQWKLDAVGYEKLSSLGSPNDIRASLMAVYQAEAELNGCENLFIKENQIYDYLPFIIGLTDNPSFVYSVRDPRDMVSSWIANPVLRGGTLRASKLWVHDQSQFLKSIAWLKNKYRVATTRYEDILAAPEETLRCLCTEIDIAYDPNMISFHKSDQVQSNAQEMSGWKNTSKPLLQSNAGKFRDALNSDQLLYVETLCGPLMDVFGYQRETKPDMLLENYGTIDALEEHLRPNEPIDKPEYLTSVSAEQQEIRKRWSAVCDRIKNRKISF